MHSTSYFPAIPEKRGNRSILAMSVLLVLIASGCGGVNQLPTLDEQVKAAWSEVLNQYQRRADLIPNLVETVKGYAHQEQQVLTEVTEARAKATQMQLPPDILSNPDKFKEFEQNQAALGGALGRLLAVSEKYPDLKSNQNFLALAVAARGHRKSHRGGAPRLHFGGATIQYVSAHLSGQMDRGLALS